MREIKFRAWDRNKKVMIYNPAFLMADSSTLNEYKVVTLDCCTKKECDGKLGCEHLSYEVDGYLDGGLYFYDAELSQYTGLKDKNGKEIYEGDILKGIGWEDAGYSTCGKVGFINSGYFVYRGDVSGEIEWMFSLIKAMTIEWNPEVVGNIYENPELLKEKK